MSLLSILLLGYLYGIGNLIAKLLKVKDDFGNSLALSLAFWSIVGWFSLGFFSEVVVFFSLLGTSWILYQLFRDFKGWFGRTFTIVFLFTVIAMLLRYLMVLPFLYPFRKDFIMHSYTTESIVQHNGYGSTYYPFDVPGLGSFNIGFHYISAGISILSGMHSMDAVVFCAFLMWGLFYYALYRYVGDHLTTLIAVFTLPYPLSFMRWGGFPTLGAIAFSLLAFRNTPKKALPFWIGAFSIHFIPSLIPFMVFILEHRRKWKEFIYYLAMIVLLPQYFLIFKYALEMSPYEMLAVDTFVVDTFKKSLVVFMVLAFFAFVGYRYGGRRTTPIWGVVLSFFAGIVSFIFAYLHLPMNAPKSLYLARMIVLILPPAAVGVHVLYRKFGFFFLPVPLMVSSLVFYLHAKVSLDREDWKLLESLPKSKEWYLVSYNSIATYLPALGIPAWRSHYSLTQQDDFKRAFLKNGAKYVVCDTNDPEGPSKYYREICSMGTEHEDVKMEVARSKHLRIYELRD